MKKAIIAAAFTGAAFAFAAPAAAQPDVTFDCSPCTGAPWTDFFQSVGPWETIFDSTNGNPTDKKGAWEELFDQTDGVSDGQGAWEKVFPPAPD